MVDGYNGSDYSDEGDPRGYSQELELFGNVPA
jgi:hypothetical protein